MIDALDTKTQNLQLDEQPAKPKRGRPATGKALSNADRQRAYRERQKSQRNEIPASGPTWEDVKLVTNQVDELWEKLQTANARIVELEGQLAQRNEKPARIKRHRDQPAAELPDESGIPDHGTWTVQFKMRAHGQRSWTSCSKAQIDFEGVPDKFEIVKSHVDSMSKTDSVGAVWRAVRDDGLIYEPKAPKWRRKQPAKQ